MPEPESSRLHLDTLERRHPWLPLLLDCYAVVDASVRRAIDEAASRDGRSPACGSGCSVCCEQPIPATPLEVMGIRLYIQKEMSASLRSALRQHQEHSPASSVVCRFLMGGACAIYPLRPVACRRYIVLGARCAPGETSTETRPDDMLLPSRAALNHALSLTLPYYAAQGQEVPEHSDAFAFCASQSVMLHSISESLLS